MLVLYSILSMIIWILCGFGAFLIAVIVKSAFDDENFSDEVKAELKDRGNILFYICGPIALILSIILAAYSFLFRINRGNR